MPRKKITKVIIDTNLWISFLIGKKLASLKDFIVEEKVILIICEQLLTEIKEVTSRPKIKKYFPEAKVDELIDFLELYAENYEIILKVELCRDLKDNFLLDLALKSNAQFIVTSDNDLLVLEKLKNTEIIGFKEFERRMK